MEFLVTIYVDLPPDYDPDAASALRKAEAERGAELYAAGITKRIWRVVGKRAAIAIFEADDGDALHDVLSALPLFPWMDIDIVPLATHYVEAAARRGS